MSYTCSNPSHPNNTNGGCLICDKPDTLPKVRGWTLNAYVDGTAVKTRVSGPRLEPNKRIRVVEASASLALEAELSLAKQDRDSWKQSFSIQQDAANKHITAFEAEIEKCHKDYDQVIKSFTSVKAKLTAANERAKGLVECLKIIASHSYAGMATADAFITIAREALLKYKGDAK